MTKGKGQGEEVLLCPAEQPRREGGLPQHQTLPSVSLRVGERGGVSLALGTERII